MTMPVEIDLSALPPEIRAAFEAKRARRLALEADVAALAEHNRRLEHLVAEFRQVLYGKRSEKLSEDERQLAFEDLETAVAAAEEAKARASATPAAPRPAHAGVKRNQGRLPEALPRIERVIEPASTFCPCGCGEMARIGEDRVERLDVIPAQFRVLVTIRPKYACRRCAGGVAQAPAPAHLIEVALPTERLIAHVLVSKYADHLPLYRQSQIFARRNRAQPLDAGGLGRQGRLPPRAHRRAHGQGPEALDQALSRRNDGAGARSRPRTHEDRLYLGSGAR
jgi:transposase